MQRLLAKGKVVVTVGEARGLRKLPQTAANSLLDGKEQRRIHLSVQLGKQHKRTLVMEKTHSSPSFNQKLVFDGQRLQGNEADLVVRAIDSSGKFPEA